MLNLTLLDLDHVFARDNSSDTLTYHRCPCGRPGGVPPILGLANRAGRAVPVYRQHPGWRTGRPHRVAPTVAPFPLHNLFPYPNSTLRDRPAAYFLLEIISFQTPGVAEIGKIAKKVKIEHENAVFTSFYG